jgi:hypothetical protein
MFDHSVLFKFDYDMIVVLNFGEPPSGFMILIIL